MWGLGLRRSASQRHTAPSVMPIKHLSPASYPSQAGVCSQLRMCSTASSTPSDACTTCLAQMASLAAQAKWHRESSGAGGAWLCAEAGDASEPCMISAARPRSVCPSPRPQAPPTAWARPCWTRAATPWAGWRPPRGTAARWPPWTLPCWRPPQTSALCAQAGRPRCARWVGARCMGEWHSWMAPPLPRPADSPLPPHRPQIGMDGNESPDCQKACIPALTALKVGRGGGEGWDGRLHGPLLGWCAAQPSTRHPRLSPTAGAGCAGRGGSHAAGPVRPVYCRLAGGWLQPRRLVSAGVGCAVMVACDGPAASVSCTAP